LSFLYIALCSPSLFPHLHPEFVQSSK